MKDFFKILKKTRFANLWMSQLLSQFTVNVMTFLIIVKIYEHTNSTIATSFVWVAYALPAIIVGPFAAASVDMFDKRKMLIITNLTQAIIIFVYAFLHLKFFYLSYGVVMAYSLLNQFYVPAETASIPFLVPKANLPRANGLFFITEQTAIVIGFSVAGVLSEIFGFGSAFAIAGFCLAAATFSVSFLPSMKPKIRGGEIERSVAEFFSRIVEGYSFIKNNKKILMPFLFLVGFQVALAIAVINLPELATSVIKTQARYAGLLMVLPAGAGAFLGTILIPQLLDRGQRKKKVVERGMLGIVIGLFSLILIIPYVNFWMGRMVSVLGFLLIGYSFVSVIVPSLTFLQEATPGGLMGRVFGNFWFITTSATVLPVLFSATITDIFGVRPMFAILASFLLLSLIISKSYGDKILYKV